MVTQQLHRILYVEDEPDIRQIAQVALETVGHFSLKVCASGEEAVHALQEFQPDLILLDVMMPGMDGPTTLGRLRELPESFDVPAIFMTAKVQPDEIAQLKRIGALDVIAKPFDPMTLAHTVRTIWSSHRPAAAVVRTPPASAHPGPVPMAETLQQMAKQFGANLPARVAEIADLWQLLSAGRGASELPQTLHRKVHSLTGSAQTFGYAPVSEAARRLDSQLVPFASSEQCPDPSQLASLAGLVVALQSSVGCTPTPMLEPSAAPQPASKSFLAPLQQSRLVYLLGQD